MSGTEIEIVHPRTKEVLALKTAPTDQLADIHDLWSDAERELRSARREVDDEMIDRLDHEGKRSITLDGFKLGVNAPLEKDWDLKALKLALERSVLEGLISPRKADACIRLEPKPVWAELKTLLSDPRIKSRIEACFTEVEAHRYLRVERK